GAGDARRLPRSRAPQLDPELRSLRPRRRSRATGPRDRGTVRGSESEVRVMSSFHRLSHENTKTRKHEEHLVFERRFLFRAFVVSWFRVLLIVGIMMILTSSPFAATKAIRAGKLVDSSGKIVTNAIIV